MSETMKMNFSSFMFLLTGDCNFDCSYCYQKKDKKYLKVSTAKKAVDYFFPHLNQDCFINFYGGEPLLAFEQMREVVEYIQSKNKKQKKHIEYSTSTNGSLIDEDVLQFLNRNKFSVLLSFDGLAQEVARRKGSFSPIASVMEKLRGCSNIKLVTNSTFTAETVSHLSKAIPFIIESGVPTANLSFSLAPPWDSPALSRLREELSSLREYSLSFYEKSGKIPLASFRKNERKSVFGCSAGKSRMALSPDGNLWGCFQFHDFFRNHGYLNVKREYCFGSLDSFMENHEKIYPDILANYSDFRMENFFTSERPCMRCEDLEDCVVCPVDTSLGHSIIGKVPDWFCKIKRIIREENKHFHRDLEALN